MSEPDIKISRCIRPHAAVIVAHPDDEILWCGGYMLAHPDFHWHIVTLCRAQDVDRAPKFRRVLRELNAEGEMADLDDEPAQAPLPDELLEQTILRLLPLRSYSLLITHGSRGEYTRHRRHEECSRAVMRLWSSGRIEALQLWLFAYEDDGGSHLPRACLRADRHEILNPAVWLEKRRLMMEIYGYQSGSWEANTTPREEAFWSFNSTQALAQQLVLWGQQA